MTLGFAYEADMLAPIAEHAQFILGENGFVRFEVPSAAGIPDVVFAILKPDVLEHRRFCGYLTDPTHLAVVSALSHPRLIHSPKTVDQLSFSVGISRKHLALKILPHLQGLGFIKELVRDVWEASIVLRSPVERLVTVEAKVRDWRQGLAQAARHAAGADESWLVLDSRYSRTAMRAQEVFQANSVGLATIAGNGRWTTLIPPRPRATLGYRRELLAERVAHMIVAGEVAGPMPSVFGKRWSTTKSADPRLADALVR